jgi:hypothetical protein
MVNFVSQAGSPAGLFSTARALYTTHVSQISGRKLQCLQLEVAV